MHARENALNKWLRSIFGEKPFTLVPIAGDASFRHYSRLHVGGSTQMVMDAPPDKEAIIPFINIANKLATVSVRTPTIFAVEQAQGFILLEDFGDQLLLHTLSSDNADMLYKTAMATLLQIQQCPVNNPTLPCFNKTHIFNELSLFREWFLQAYLALQLNTNEELLLKETFNWLATAITAQPQVFIHRDYHSRNLMIIDNQHMGVIDFQDAMCGPFTYDLVSLLKDCYIQWPREQVVQWMSDFYHKLPVSYGWSLEDFSRAFDLCGLQRHLKVLGIFCRLHLRDNKPTYLRDLPLIMNYVNGCLETNSELQPFYQFMQHRVYQPFTEKSQT